MNLDSTKKVYYFLMLDYISHSTLIWGEAAVSATQRNVMKIIVLNSVYE